EYTAIYKSAPKLKEFTSLIRGLRQIAESEPLPVLIEKTIDLTGYRNMLLHEGEEALDRLSNIQELISNAVEYVNNAEEPSLTGFREEVALISDIDNYDDEADAVVLMTIHSAKGLEFPVVFLPGMEDGIFPGMQAVMFPEELEEERRLAYVAITRAREKLYATHVRERLIYGRTQYNHISRFVEEIPAEFVDAEDPRKKQQEQPRERRPKHVISKEFTKQSDLSASVGKSTSFDRFGAGDRVSHIMFGKGTVLSATDMGSDVLYEIAFDEKGTKKLMATYAKLKKCEE
nr:ATP-binding domain-containing protein [Clostridia bacterium]